METIKDNIPTSAGFLIRSNGLFLLCHTTQGPNQHPHQFDGKYDF